MNVKLIPKYEISDTDDFIVFKIILVGNSGVGKYEILERACFQGFDQSYQATIGFEFLLMHFLVNDIKIKLQIWDTIGQEMYKSLIQGFYRNTSLALLIYDISDRRSFDYLDIQLKDIRAYKKELPIFIIGNRCDLERQISFDEGKDFSLANGAKYFMECSSKTGYNFENIFSEAAKYLYSVVKNITETKYKSLNEKINIKNNIKFKCNLSKYQNF